ASIPVERWEFRRTPSVKALLGKANKRSGAFELESVRQWALKELIEQLKFPAPWIGTRITPLESEDVFGFSILNDLGTPFILAAAAPPGHTDKAESALRNYLRRTAHASIGIVTDGTPGGTRFIQPNRYVDTCDYIRDLDP